MEIHYWNGLSQAMSAAWWDDSTRLMPGDCNKQFLKQLGHLELNDSPSPFCTFFFTTWYSVFTDYISCQDCLAWLFQNLGGLLIFKEQIESRTLILYTKLRCYHTAELLLCSLSMASHSKSAIMKWMAIPKPLEKKSHLHVLGTAQNEYFVATIPFFFCGPLSL